MNTRCKMDSRRRSELIRQAKLEGSGQVGIQGDELLELMHYGHQLYEPEGMDGCAACDVCNGAEGTLPLFCPGRRMTEAQSEAVYAGELEFFHNKWWILMGKAAPSLDLLRMAMEEDKQDVTIPGSVRSDGTE